MGRRLWGCTESDTTSDLAAAAAKGHNQQSEKTTSSTGESVYNSSIQNTQGAPKLSNSIKTQLNGQDPTTGRSGFMVLCSRAKANRVLSGEHTGHSKYPLSTTQETTLHMDISRWSIPKLD